MRWPQTRTEVSAVSLWGVHGLFVKCLRTLLGLLRFAYLAIPQEKLSYLCPVPYNSICPNPNPNPNPNPDAAKRYMWAGNAINILT